MSRCVTDVHGDTYLTRCVQETIQGVKTVHGNTYLTSVLETLQDATDVVHGDTHCTRCVLEMLQGVMGVVHSGTYLYRCILDTSRWDKCCTWQHILRLGVLEILHGVTDVHGNTCLARCILEMLQGEPDDVHRDTYLIRLCSADVSSCDTCCAHRPASPTFSAQ